MKKYKIYGKVTGSKYLGTVDAESEDQAIEMANGLDLHVSFCHQCGDEIEDPNIETLSAWEDNA